jgi:hypothetical protein
MLSPIATVVESMIVLVPDTVKLPLTVTLAPLKPIAVSNDEVNDLNEPVEV